MRVTTLNRGAWDSLAMKVTVGWYLGKQYSKQRIHTLVVKGQPGAKRLRHSEGEGPGTGTVRLERPQGLASLWRA